MRVNADVRGNVLHDRLPSMRLWRHVALTRELVALSTVLSAARTTTLRWRAGHSISSNRETGPLMLPIVPSRGNAIAELNLLFLPTLPARIENARLTRA